MNKLFVILLVFLAPCILYSQGAWNSNQKTAKKGRGGSELQPIGLLLGGDGTLIAGRTGLPSIAEGNFNAAMFVGPGAVSAVILAGAHSHSEITSYSTQSMQYDPYCGCYPQTQTARDFSPYLRTGHFQVGLAFQTEGTILYVTAGIANVHRIAPTWTSDTTLEMISLPRYTSPVFSFSGKFKVSEKDILTADVLAFAKKDAFGQMFGKASVSYLFGFNPPPKKLYGGIQASYLSHSVSGHEFMFGPKFLFGTAGSIPTDISLSFGGSYNPDPNEGLGFYVTFGVSVNRQYKFIYD